MNIPMWLFCTLVILLVVLPPAMGFLGAWLCFRIKHAGTGYSFMPAKDENEKPASYVEGLFDDLKNRTILEDMPLSKEAQRIREQQISGQPEDIRRMMNEVEGLA